MSRMPDVVVLMALCSRHKKSFGVRLEQKSRRQWVADWAFPLQEKAAKKEGYDRTEIKGQFSFDQEYPGCPYCENPGLFHCSCDQIACWDSKTNRVTCPACGDAIELGGTVTSLRAGGDR